MTQRIKQSLRAAWDALPGGVLALMVCSQLLVVAPLIVSHYTAPAGTTPSYYGYLTQDHSVYENYITQAKQGRFTFQDRFTSEPQAIGIFNIFWWSVGSMARALNLESWSAIVVARLILAPLIILTLYYVAGLALNPKDTQARFRLTVYLMFANGIGFLFTSLITPGPADFLAPEAMVNTVLMTSPHMMLSFMLLVLCYALFFRWTQTWQTKFLAASAFAGALLLQFHPYFAPMIPLTTGLWLVWSYHKARQASTPSVGALRQAQTSPITGRKATALYMAFLGTLALPMVYFLFTLSDPFTQLRYATNITISQPLWSTIATFSIIGALAYRGFRAHKQHSFAQFAVLWVAIAFVMMYVPTPVNRRFLQGAIVPLGILAFLSIRALANSGSNSASAYINQVRTSVLIFLTTIGGAINVLIIAQLIATAHVPKQLQEITQFMATQPAGVILGIPEDVAFIIGRTHHTAYVAHWSETIDLARKTQFARAFLDFPVHPELATVLLGLPPLTLAPNALVEKGITYVITKQKCPEKTQEILKIGALHVCSAFR